MQINPVSVALLQYSGLNRKAEIKPQNITFSSSKKATAPWPRRFPDYCADTTLRTYDSFTGLRDKNYLLSSVSKARDTKIRDRRELSLAMFDMDNFKSVNELLGYQTGDNFIKAISQKISEVAKSDSANAYRFGGEEFVILFDRQSKATQKAITEKIITAINSDEYICSKAPEYRANAEKKLEEYTKRQEKIAPLIPLKAKKDLLEDLRQNMTSEEAKQDPYLLQSIETTKKEIKDLYITLIDERLADETEEERTKNILKTLKAEYQGSGEIGKAERKELDEYLHSVYDKTYEIHQIKKWLHDFDQNGGFSITGDVVSFSPGSLKGKTALDIINQAGEVLKESKNIKKGHSYYRNIE